MTDWWGGQDGWFDRYWADKVTEEFAAWWVGHYGPPLTYCMTAAEQHEYWSRMAFALQGWLAAKERA
jgi:hypothetical protein